MNPDEINSALEDIKESLMDLSTELLKISDKHVYTVILINDIKIAIKQIQKEVSSIWT